ncbi:MAG: hypothetical protein IH831_10505 [Planctomycetes bacterium]|nr:hypothetical protein [Planctomycetota bacterium]
MADKTFRIAVSRLIECKQTTVVEVLSSDAKKAKARAIETVQVDANARDWLTLSDQHRKSSRRKSFDAA